MFMMKPLGTLCVVTYRPRARITVVSAGAGDATTNGCTCTWAGEMLRMVLDAARSMSMFQRIDWPKVTTRGLCGSNVMVTVSEDMTLPVESTAVAGTGSCPLAMTQMRAGGES